MHNFMVLGSKQKIIIGIVFSFFIVVGLGILVVFVNDKLAFSRSSSIPHGGLEYVIDERPTDFVKAGTITVNNPGLSQGELYFIYEEPGKPALKKEIVMDALSVCGSLPCVAMSISFDIAFHGKRVVVEGVKEGENSIIARKITVVPDGGEVRLPGLGSIFVPWMYVRSLITECEVSSIMQTHSLDVYVTIKENNRRVRTVEPGIDEVFRALDEVTGSCPSISVATE